MGAIAGGPRKLERPTQDRKPPLPDHAAGRVGRPPKAGRKPVRKTDITLPKNIVADVKAAAKALGVSILEYGRLAVQSFAKFLLFNPDAVVPLPTRCEHCDRPYVTQRSKDGKNRVRVQVHFDDATNEAMLFVADNYYNGTFSRAFEGAVMHYMKGTTTQTGGA